MAQISFKLNGVARTVTVDNIETPLLWVLRDLLGLTGTKYGCGVEICGACTVLVNGQPEKSCDESIGEVAGKSVMTIEALNSDPLGAKLQAAWLQHQVPQCGFCQSGMLMAAYGRLKAGESRASTASGLSNICQCGTFQRVKEAILSLPGVA
ncbi:(2Fe-2S)-binding protein [Aestuariivirga litoralis]|uniref:(2Fe-2S)-binding protein n=1 Tax=Aestuariivirga litoralis TaxID=2650924 RepID=A0A2W2CCQ7_9HYPH|nr:(2Fe-2S)-binding protein [Aestuariivirga litoralis]PZF77993.1 (2Fe-2S)-binding protein [Aestuariivirga litoralis]